MCYVRHDIKKSIDRSQYHVNGRHVVQFFTQDNTVFVHALPVWGITFLNNYVLAALVVSRLKPLNMCLRLLPESWKRKLTADSDCGHHCSKTRQGSRPKNNKTTALSDNMFNKWQLQKSLINEESRANAFPLYN